MKAFKHTIDFLLPLMSIINLSSVRTTNEFIAAICKTRPMIISKAELHMRNDCHVETPRICAWILCQKSIALVSMWWLV